VDPLELVVANVKPLFGAAAVGPTADVSVTFNLPVDEIPAEAVAVVVDDGLATLAGTWTRSPAALTWTWTPDVQMSLGANVTLRLASGI
jgi:hypothetical protein